MSVDDLWFSGLRGVHAQLLRLLNDLGVRTVSQDYIFHVYGHP